MIIKYEIIVTIINLIDSSTSKFSKEFEIELLDSPTLYNNNHVLSNNVNILNVFNDEIQSYITALEIESSSVDIEEFEVVSLTDGVNVFFEDSEENVIPLSPTLKCFIGPKNEPLKVPKLVGVAYDSTTIIWSWPEDEEYAHYLIDETYDTTTGAIVNTIAQIPARQKTYVETNLKPDTAYTRRLVNYDQEQTSMPSNSVTVQTETVVLDKKLSEYNIARNYDFTTLDSDREIIKDNLEAFHSGIGDFNDLKVYKQMDADFYQKFKAYFEITGKRFQREKRYSQVGFNYKVCLEATEEVEEQEGEVTFDINVYPREWVSIQDYMYETYPVKVRTRLLCTVFLRKEVTGTEDEPHFVYEPIYRPKYSYYNPQPPLDGSYEREMTVIISLDMSSSLRFMVENKLKLNLIKESAITIINGVDAKVRQEVPDAIIEWIVYGWGGVPSAIVKPTKTTDKSKAISAISAMTYFKNNPSSNTNFHVGLNHWKKMNPSYEKKAMVFITDGFCNRNASGSTYAPQTGRPGSSAVLNAISIDTPIPTAGVFLNGASHYDEDYRNSSYFNEAKTMEFAHQIQAKLQAVCQSSGGATFPNPLDDGMEMKPYVCEQATEFVINNTEKLLKKKNQGVDPNPQDMRYNGYQFHWNGAEWTPQEVLDAIEDPENVSKQDKAALWEKLNTNNWRHLDGVEFENWAMKLQGTEIKQYDIDDYTYVNVNIEYDTMLFKNGPAKKSYYNDGYFNIVTPVEYDRNERRAIVPNSSMFINEKLTVKGGQIVPIYNLIMEQVMATQEWAHGYNKTIGTSENFGEEDMFLVRGLMIQNTYNFSDDDYQVNDPSFGLNDWEDGWNGSVNTYTDMNFMGTTSYGDDCYLVSRDNYVMMQGYTDAIIYDGIRYPTEELNAYDRPQETLISTNTDYRRLLMCRKLNTLSYYDIGGQDQPYHVLDVLRKDDDIYFTGQANLVDNLIKEKDWSNGGKLTQDFIAHNDQSYFSPVLNYRFNIEDPDAKTPIYEILPDCNPYSDYLHIVILHVYYAKNVYITNLNNYISNFADNPLKNTSDPYIPLVEHLYKWTLKEWHDGYGNDDGWYIDSYLWFLAKPMVKIQKYYDEIPAEGMDSMYGLVNGRYNSDSQQGKQDLTIQTPKFNIPTTVTDKHLDSVRIYIMVSEFYPSDALVAYKWERPYDNINSITDYYGNGSYVTFSSDSITYKDIEYKDLIQTINYEDLEVNDNKTFENIYEIDKPDTILEYENYYLNVDTDNSDVLALRYPSEIVFNAENKAQIPVAFKGVVNATSKWSPVIHNGYYYLNQHEYYAYSEFDVKANFEKYDEEVIKTLQGYISIEVILKHAGGKSESYNINKVNRSELIQDEDHFVWIDGQGLTLKPAIDGEYYKRYDTVTYTSPVIMFPNILTTVGKLNVIYELEDGSTYLPLEVRSYNLDEGKWNAWQPFANNSVPSMQNDDNTTSVLYSNAYQIRFQMQASETNEDITCEDYLCCYLDWKDDASEQNLTNVETITDYITNGPDLQSHGEYVSKIIDLGSRDTEVMVNYFDSNYNEHVQLFVASSDIENLLLLENITWVNLTNANHENRLSSLSEPFKGRYFRYKLIIPPGEKLYWLHKVITTQKTTVIRPFLKGIQMTGEYVSTDVVTNFINTEAFEIPTDGEQHVIFNNIQKLIGSDVLSKGYTLDEIEGINITSASPSIEIEYSPAIENKPSLQDLNTDIKASTPFDYYIKTQYTPFIYDEKDEYENDMIVIHGTPQQYAPITVEDEFGNSYIQIFDGSDVDLSQYGYNAENMAFMRIKEEFIIDESSVKFISLKRNNYEPSTLTININNVYMHNSLYKTQNHLIIFNDELCIGDKVEVYYYIENSFIADIDRTNNITKLRLYSNHEDYNQPVVFTDKIKSNYSKESFINKYEIITPSLDSLHTKPVIENCTFDNTSFVFEESGTIPICYVTKDSYDEYKISVNIQSTFGAQYANGLLLGLYLDEENKYHTLSLVLLCGDTDLILGDDDNPSDCDIFLIYDINQSTQKIIWADYWNIDKPNGWVDFSMNLFAQKSYINNDRLIIRYNKWGNTEDIFEKTFNIEDEEYPELLNNFDLSTQFGLLNFKQKDSYFIVKDLECFNYKEITKKHKVYFETGKHNNKFVAEDLSLNPIYRTDYKGFIYLSDEHYDAYYLNIYCNPKTIFAGGYDKVDISIEVLDINKNPVINRKVEVDNIYGILNIDNNKTDMNGIVHIVYESALSACTDTITAKVTLDDNSVLEQSIDILNKSR